MTEGHLNIDDIDTIRDALAYLYGFLHCTAGANGTASEAKKLRNNLLPTLRRVDRYYESNRDKEGFNRLDLRVADFNHIMTALKASSEYLQDSRFTDVFDTILDIGGVSVEDINTTTH